MSAYLIDMTPARILWLQKQAAEHADGPDGWCSMPACDEPAPCWFRRDAEGILAGAGLAVDGTQA